VFVGAVEAVGKDVAMGAGVVVGAEAGAQADKIKLTSKNIVHERFIVFNFPFSSYCCPI